MFKLLKAAAASREIIELLNDGICRYVMHFSGCYQSCYSVIAIMSTRNGQVEDSKDTMIFVVGQDLDVRTLLGDLLTYLFRVFIVKVGNNRSVFR